LCYTSNIDAIPYYGSINIDVIVVILLCMRASTQVIASNIDATINW
jgi:hypothetical protein